MIENDQQLEATHEALGCLYRALASLRHKILPINPSQYALFAEGPLDEISKLQAEIDAYLGLNERNPATASDPRATAEPVLHEKPPPYGGSRKS